MKYHVGVLGAGSWGFALSIAFSHVMSVTIWGRNKEQMADVMCSRSSKNYIPETVKLADSIEITSDLDQAIIGKDLIVIATPVSGLREMFRQIRQKCIKVLPDIIWVCKGLEAGSGLLPHQIAMEELGNFDNIGALLGPSFAKEVALGLPTAITLSSRSTNFAGKWINLFRNIPNLRVYANTDVIGSEVGSAIKNIMAIAVGISDGLDLGYNARAALITRSLNEISLMVTALGGEAKTIYGLTGIGDLILTCTGDLSRNRRVGLELAKGKACSQILQELGHVAEGVYATDEMYKLSKKFSLTMPIVSAVHSILYQNANIKDAVSQLLNRSPKFEI